MLSKMKESSIVLSKLVNDNEVNLELEKLIGMNMYKDDFILFKDLFSPSSNQLLKSCNIEKTIFETAFDDAAGLSGLKSANLDDLKQYLSDNSLALYIPYPLEDYPEENRIPAISYHPLLNDIKNEGFQTVIKNGEILGYDVVEVSEEYSLTWPVYLIIPIDENKLNSFSSSSSQKPNDDYLKSVTSRPVNTSMDNISVELKEYYVANKHQFDGIFAGASELRVVRVALQKLSSHNFRPDDDFIDCSISRNAIRNETIIRCGTVLITDWKKAQTSISVGAYEYDPGDWSTTNGSAGFNYKLENSGTATVTWPIPDTPIVLTDSLVEQNGFELSVLFKYRIENKDGLLGKQTWGRSWIGTWDNGEKFYSFGDLKCTFTAESYND